VTKDEVAGATIRADRRHKQPKRKNEGGLTFSDGLQSGYDWPGGIAHKKTKERKHRRFKEEPGEKKKRGRGRGGTLNQSSQSSSGANGHEGNKGRAKKEENSNIPGNKKNEISKKGKAASVRTQCQQFNSMQPEKKTKARESKCRMARNNTNTKRQQEKKRKKGARGGAP